MHLYLSDGVFQLLKSDVVICRCIFRIQILSIIKGDNDWQRCHNVVAVTGMSIFDPSEIARTNFLKWFTLKNSIDTAGSMSILGKHASVNGHSSKVFHYHIATVIICPVANKASWPQMRIFCFENRTRLIRL